MKSPIKDKPLPTPGESLLKQINDLVFDRIPFLLVVASAFSMMAISEWWRWYLGTPPQPAIWTLMALALVGVFLWQFRTVRRQVVQLRLGLAGERAIGEFLERLRASGAQVFHDIPGKGFNLDHVVIHETGVYVVETKTLSKPEHGEARLTFDGETVRKNGLEPDRNPIVQVRAGSRWLTELLTESTGRSFPVRPVVVYRGWYIEPTAEAKASDVWVLNPKGAPFVHRTQ